MWKCYKGKGFDLADSYFQQQNFLCIIKGEGKTHWVVFSRSAKLGG